MIDTVTSAAAGVTNTELLTALSTLVQQSESSIAVRDLVTLFLVGVGSLIYIAKNLIPLFKKGDYNRPVQIHDLPPAKAMYGALDAIGKIHENISKSNDVLLQKDQNGQNVMLGIPVWLQKLAALAQVDSDRSERLEMHIASLVNHQMDVLKEIATIIRDDRNKVTGTMDRLDAHISKMDDWSARFPK